MPFSDQAPRLELAPFRARLPWLGGDLQSVRNALAKPVPPRPAARSSRLILPLADGTGDRLHVTLDEPAAPRPGLPLALFAHGVSGSEDSYYMLATAARLIERGYHVVRLNLRGAGPSRIDCKRHYHAGRSGDLRDAIAALPTALTANGAVAVGFSLGGNTVLKLAGEQGAGGPVVAVASVCAPIDIGLTTANLARRRNKVYQKVLLKPFKAEYVAPGAELSDALRAAVERARNFAEFDATVTAPRNGYASAQAFYDDNGARHHVAGIRVPALVIAAQDDPIVPFAPYAAIDWRALPWTIPAFTRTGGHVGHHGRDGIWYVEAIDRFLASLEQR
ncbi:alpha/beta fold hydrolase [Oleomonas cavernae]|uniref:Alpha/beta fold hydrolase n=1 Tax=Oleomonas cavernae TaxID=2320859 RepID=A0A418VTI7_9PROT|nr:alpha/beta fold hydrolase [Oleomonas cavernae]RJF80454.1 alpha/beta fold hydrolase [Oleomonas cavernae]